VEFVILQVVQKIEWSLGLCLGRNGRRDAMQTPPSLGALGAGQLASSCYLMTTFQGFRQSNRSRRRATAWSNLRYP